MKNLSEIRAVITGGASGLGLATAQAIVNNGGQVVILDMNAVQGEKSQRGLGPSAFFVETNVTEEARVDDAIQRSVEVLGRLNLAVNCAGIAPSKRVLGRDELMSTEDFSKVINTNLNGCFSVIRSVANAMQHNEPDADKQRGVIINTASIAAFDGLVGQAAYSASKAGIVGMTLPLAREFSRIGVRVMTLAPGLFRTPLFDTLPASAVEALEASTPFPARLGKPSEFAAMVCHIFQNTMLNGETIRLDGALRMS
ncbi:MAG TPA: SDR family NAD(P)-dependent oxidoreductase [Gammaproteobacteria bacterium]|nr:SDR family NAD(P)-dependent oxidoreductase [Gammaproteobacteria bacterium]